MFINFIIVACRIYSRLKWYKNYNNRLRLGKVIIKNKMSRFYGSLCSVSMLVDVSRPGLTRPTPFDATPRLTGLHQIAQQSAAASCWLEHPRPYERQASCRCSSTVVSPVVSRTGMLLMRSRQWMYTVSQKNVPLLFFQWLCQKLTDFNDFWCVKYWENLTSIACTFAHLTCIL